MTARSLRILHVVRRYEPMLGGTERYVGDLARAQVVRGHAVTVLTLDRDVNGVVPGRLVANETAAGVRVVRLAGFGSARFGVVYRPDTLLREIRRADVTHLHDLRFMTGTVAIANRLRHRPTFVHTHGLIYGTRNLWRLKRLMSSLYYEPVLLAAGAYVVCSSDADLQRLTRFMPRLAARSSTIANGVELMPFRAVERTPVPGRIVAIGRVTPIKGLDRLLNALGQVRGDWSLEIHGAAEGDEVRRLRTMAAEIGIAERVTFKGSFEPAEEPAILASAALAVFPSRSEALGIALIDALASGVPVIASDIAGHRSALGPLAGLHVVDFEHRDLAAAAIDRSLAAPPAAVTETSRREQEQADQFDVARLVAELDGRYRDLGILA